MTSSSQPRSSARVAYRRALSASTTPRRAALAVLAIVVFVLWVHVGSSVPTFRADVSAEPGWERFRAEYQLNHFGEDGQFVRAVQNGYNLVFYTYKYAPRFTRRVAGDRVNSCSGCHTVEDLAYGFVNSDRYDPKLARRTSFEERVQRCYARSMDGFVPTIYDPAVRDIRLLSRAVAHHLQLSEGALRRGR
jgi:cytochrome c